MKRALGTPDLLLKTEHSLCPGCGEPVALRVILELLQDLGLRERTICVAGIGCYTAFPMIMDVDVMQALHGRAPSVATGVKRVRPDAFVFTMQGDGDMISEGLQEVIHSAARGEKFTAIVFNNAVFGETGGHMTAATVLGQHTKSTVGGRDRDRHGYPIKISELVAQLDGTAYVARAAMHTPSGIKLAKQYLHDAFRAQLDAKGFSLVELLTMCPTDWFVPPEQGPAFLEKHLIPTFPLGVIKGG
ncbi:MAG TPA: thiamine pyrophosphate-dependent enzyme [Candidatus Binatia bacterium]|nr:thiamine pyrophosphate-dependent enzyme [Candidatus Binatia bacterium]